jgi:hypothetical protein
VRLAMGCEMVLKDTLDYGFHAPRVSKGVYHLTIQGRQMSGISLRRSQGISGRNLSSCLHSCNV